MTYEILGEPMPVVVCQVKNGEKMINESGSMVWMSPNMTMETSAGGIGKAFGRLFSGESIFQNIYTANGDGMITFASVVPGSIRVVDVAPGHDVIIQKTAFLASEAGVELSVHFQKKAASGLFSGEGFIMQRLSGQGKAFLEIDGSVVEYELDAGQKIIVDTGNLAMCDASCSIDVVTVKGLKNKLLGGEGLFHTVVTGPGKVTLQTMPVRGLASALIPYLPLNSGN